MKLGQRYDGKGNISQYADYVQLNICGLSAIEIVQRYFLYDINRPIVLLGDYTSEGRNAREDDMLRADRIFEIKDAITSLKAFGAEIWAITIHPVSRAGLKKFGAEDITFKKFIDKLNEIYQIPVLVKNRQYDSLHLSKPEEIIEFSYTNKITIDSVFLFESCGYDKDYYMDTVSKINLSNVQEIHIRNYNLEGTGYLDIVEYDEDAMKKILSYTKKIPWITFAFTESGVGHPQFDLIAKKMVTKIQEADDRC